MGYTMSETVPITYSNGVSGTKMHTKWTQKGRLFLYQTLKENGYIPLIERDMASRAVLQIRKQAKTAREII